MSNYVLNGKDLTLDGLYEIAFEGKKVEIDPAALEKAAKARQVLFDMAAKGRPVYGLNRGVGWNKDREFDQDFFEQYNRNLLNSHSCGIDPVSSIEEVRAMMAIRLNTALVGSTGIGAEILVLYAEFLNRGITPVVPRRGSIGEGDISTMSHIGLSFIGEGEVFYKGERMPSQKALDAEGLKSVILGPKDGLSIVSSNAHGAAFAAMVVREVRSVIKSANLVYSLGLEGLNGVLESLSPKVNELRGFKGQTQCAKECLEYLKGSYLHQPDPARALQDPICFRGGYAVNGAVLDALNFLEENLQIQLNSTDDNPCILIDENTTSVSTNFEVTIIAAAVEMVAITMAHMSRNIAYRMVKLGDPTFTGLSRFLTPQDVTYIGYGVVQKAFASIDAENRMLANPSSMDCFAIAGTIEDHASNLPLAADKVLKLADNLRYMLAMELMHAAQAIDLRGVDGKLGSRTGTLFSDYRKIVPFYDKDRNCSADIRESYNYVCGLQFKNLL